MLNIAQSVSSRLVRGLWLRCFSQLWPAFLVIENSFNREFPMSRFLVASLVVCSVFVVSASDAQAGLFGKLRGGRSGGCGQASSCAPAPTCCAQAPVRSCSPAPQCCSAPAPVSSGCNSCGSSVVSSGCSSCGSSVVSSGCSSCGGGNVMSASYNGGVVTSGCPNCSQTMNSGVIYESAAPQAAPPAPATSAPAAPAAPTPDAAPSAPAATPAV